ncbi:hypothetical protein DQG23_00085 [Paenibacillus contaminans]|uniref:Uncharacterized protein n=1 Tax=Paenibacillus contaminans TaxID=450362 RepID=A0A329MS87_9BACL|nr:hypothetical protein DQG23_00085 [Paenibacillus contaminans]
MCLECASERTPIYPMAVYKATKRMEQSTITNPLRINGIIQHQVAQKGYNLYPGHVEWFDEGSETWIAAEIPAVVWYMSSAEEIVAYLDDYFNFLEV